MPTRRPTNSWLAKPTCSGFWLVILISSENVWNIRAHKLFIKIHMNINICCQRPHHVREGHLTFDNSCLSHRGENKSTIIMNEGIRYNCLHWYLHEPPSEKLISALASVTRLGRWTHLNSDTLLPLGSLVSTEISQDLICIVPTFLWRRSRPR